MTTPFNPNEPIPNDPFYYPETNYIQGPTGPVAIGPGLEITPGGDIIAIGGGPAVTYLTGGPGIYVSANTGTVSLYNTGVIQLNSGSGIQITCTAPGAFTVTNTAPAFSVGGTVTQVNTGDGLTGGPITTSGTIALSNTGVGAGTYQNATVTVDAKGRVTAASPGTSISTISGTLPIVVTPGANATISINDGSPTVSGALRICDSVSLTCSSVAASSTAVKNAYDIGAVALPCSVLTAQGDLISATAPGIPVRVPVGIDGSILKACSACSSTGGLTWDTLSLCNGTVTSVTAGTGLTGGTITATGTIALDTACVIAPSAFSGKGAILAATGAGTPIALGSGSNGQVLSVNTLCSANLEWVTPTSDIPCSAFNVKGNLLVGTGAATYCALGVGTNGQVLVADSVSTAGVCWGSVTPDAATPTLRGILYGCSGTTTTGVGCSILASLGAGLCNTAVGCSVLSSIVNGGSNTAVGYKAGSSVITNGSFNVAMGSLALGNATGTGNISNNIAIGMCSLSALVAGSCNVAVGSCSMCSQTNGGSNIAIGFASLWNSTTGIGNVAIGFGSLLSSSTAGFNIGVGYASMQSNTTGTCNIAVGICAHSFLDGGCNNVALGFSAGQNLSTGCYNVSIGDSVCLASPDGSCQLAIGFSPTENWLTGTSTKAIKPGAGIIDCAGSCGTAGQVLMSNGSNALCWGSAPSPSAATPTVAGIVKGFINATNTALGCNAAASLTTGLSNTAIGNCAGFALDDACCNTLVGTSAGCALNFGLGHTIIGTGAGAAVTTGFYNVFVGNEAGALSTQSRNVFIGACAGCAQTLGSSNVAIGDGVNVPNTTGGCQLAIGYSSSFTCWLTGNFTGAIKPGAGIIDCANSCGTVGQYLWTTGTNRIIWASSSPSDIRDKEVLGPVPTALPIVQQIEPITYRWKERDSDIAQEEVIYGFSAQQLQEVDSILVDNSDQDHLRIHDRKIVPLLVKAIQELSAKVEELEKKLSN